MDFRWLLICCFVVFLQSGCLFNDCEPDVFGNEALIVLTGFIELPRDTLVIGDTITISIVTDKEVEILGADQSPRLDSFNFFPKFFISEVSDSEENYNVDIDVIPVIGDVDILPLVTSVALPMTFVETEDQYLFEARVLVNEAGKYFMGFSSSNALYEENYEHPFVYQCEDRRRGLLAVIYTNPLTSEREYEEVFLSSPVPYFSTNYSFDDFKNELGARAFVVVEE